nr:hypothetical protein [Kibdelosporangium sp. MJ126-NF4]CTQ99048.1 hypothetical protein [Kibdelosporangium sp. MJ126-NF4]
MPEVNGDPLALVNALYESAQTLAPGTPAAQTDGGFPISWRS